MRNSMIRAAPLLGGFAALALLLVMPDDTQAQDGPEVITACYIPTSGVVYRIKDEGLDDECKRPTHVEFSWLELPVVDGNVNIEGGLKVAGTLTVGDNTITIDDATNSITSSSGVISFDDENLVTTGNVTAISFAGDGSGLTNVSVGGYERIETTATIGAGNIRTLMAICPSGKLALGGGFGISGPANPEVVIRSSSPISDQIWQSTFRNDHSFADATIHTYVVCAEG